MNTLPHDGDTAISPGHILARRVQPEPDQHAQAPALTRGRSPGAICIRAISADATGFSFSREARFVAWRAEIDLRIAWWA